MSESFKMPERQSCDGKMSVSRNGDDRLLIKAETDGNEQVLEVTDYNAARIFGALALFLGINLPARIGKEIKF